MKSSTDTQHLTLRLPKWMIEKLDEEAKATLTSRTGVLRNILLRYLNGDLVLQTNTSKSLTPVNNSAILAQVKREEDEKRKRMEAAAALIPDWEDEE